MKFREPDWKKTANERQWTPIANPEFASIRVHWRLKRAKLELKFYETKLQLRRTKSQFCGSELEITICDLQWRPGRVFEVTICDLKNGPSRGHTLSAEDVILVVRGQKVILDADLAGLYGVETKRLNEQVRRNVKRFPADFMFRLTAQEVTHLRSQFATSNTASYTPLSCEIDASKGRGGRRYLPNAFTEHGAIMAANVLNSMKAVEMSVFVVRVFIKMREQLLGRAELEKRLAEIEKVLLSHDTGLRDIYRKIRPLLLPPPEPHRERIGFRVREKSPRYGAKRRRRR